MNLTNSQKKHMNQETVDPRTGEVMGSELPRRLTRPGLSLMAEDAEGQVPWPHDRLGRAEEK